MKKQNLFLLVILVMTYSCKSSLKDETTLKIETYLNNLEQTGFSGAILVAKNGEMLLSNGYGFSNREDQIKNTPTTVFDIGSVTKQFSAAGILKLEMQEKLSVNDKLSKYFDNLPFDKQDITLHHLLTHSSGFVSAIGDDYETITTEEFVSRAFREKLLFKAGNSYEYSNIGYSLLGIIIEKLSNQTYEEFLYINLWKPANMEQTGYTRPNFGNKEAFGYKGDKNTGKSTEQKWDSDAPFWNLKGNGGILSTTEDMYKWHLALLSNNVLSKEAKEKYFSPFVQEGENAPSYYGYGWAIYNTSRDTKLAAHNGGNGIFFADFWRYLDDNMVIVLLNNNSTRYSQSIASQIGAITFSPTFEPRYPSENDNEMSKEKLDVLVSKAVKVLSKNNPKEWKLFILNYGMKDFINMAPMETHLEYFEKFHNDLKDGKVQSVSFEDDKLVIGVKSQNKIVKLIMFVELDQNGEVKFAGMKTEL